VAAWWNRVRDWGMVIDRRLAHFLVVLGVAIAALALGYAGLDEYVSRNPAAGFGGSWDDILFYDLQLFVFGSGPAQGPGPFPVPLGIARFLAPASTALATVETLRLLLSEQLRRLAAAVASRHAVVTGDGPVAVELARKLRQQYRTVVLVAMSDTTAEQGRRHGLLDVRGDPTDAATLRSAGLGRADVLYACSDLGTTNAATALRAREISQSAGRPLAAYAQVPDGALCTALRASRIGAGGDLRFRLDFFSLADTAARALLDQHRVVAADGQPADIVIVGFGRLGRAVLRETARRRLPGGPTIPVTVRHATAGEVLAFADAFPVIRRNCVLTIGDALPPDTAGTGAADGDTARADAPVPAAAPHCLVFVCLPGNENALSAGFAVATSLAAQGGRLVICMSEPAPFKDALSGQNALLYNAEERVSIFDVVEEACMPARISEDLVDQLARAIHRSYLANCADRGDSPLVNSSMRPWEDLPDDKRHANIAQAADIGPKLEAIDCVVIPESDAAPVFGFRDGETELLAKMEHQRWMRERIERGFVYGPSRTGKQHPDLVDWDNLSETARDKDRDAVRELPGILGEAGFQILRLQPK